MATLSVGRSNFGRNINNQASQAVSMDHSHKLWNDFFLTAGIPAAVANDYALTFASHRIQVDMLKDITKEILVDMGIKAMGDIIAILRHAKNFAAQQEMSVMNPRPQLSTTGAISTQRPMTDTRPALSTGRHVAGLSLSPPQASKTNSVSTIGKIQSRVNLNSGAIVASSIQSPHQVRASTEIVSNSPVRLSSAMAKRLKNAPYDSNEKTLTVRYPSHKAMEKARQRVLGGPAVASSAPRANARLVGDGSIHSRLGPPPDEPKQNGKLRAEQPRRPNQVDNSAKNRETMKNSTPLDSHRLTTSIAQLNSRLKPRGYEDSRKPEPRNQAGRLKSTVFSRLGEAPG